MKKITVALSAFLALFIISCEGPQGPPGFDGSDFEAAAFEIKINMILNANLNRYEFTAEPFPNDITLLVDDVILIYRLEEVNNGVDVWRQLPQPFLTDDGLLFYNFDFTLDDYGIFVEPDFDAAIVPLDLVSDQVFRIVVLPANLGTAKIDTSNLKSVLSALNIEEKDIKRL